MSDTPSIVEQMTETRLNRCVHFTGTQQPQCKAGVAYSTVTVKHEAIPYMSRGHEYTALRSMPCNKRLNHCGATCEKSQFLSPDEAHAEAVIAAARFVVETTHIGAARRLILAQTGNKGGAGIVECPKCGGKLHYGQASTNKHVHARCETPNCLGWME